MINMEDKQKSKMMFKIVLLREMKTRYTKNI